MGLNCAGAGVAERAMGGRAFGAIALVLVLGCCWRCEVVGRLQAGGKLGLALRLA